LLASHITLLVAVNGMPGRNLNRWCLTCVKLYNLDKIKWNYLSRLGAIDACTLLPRQCCGVRQQRTLDLGSAAQAPRYKSANLPEIFENYRMTLFRWGANALFYESCARAEQVAHFDRGGSLPCQRVKAHFHCNQYSCQSVSVFHMR
jgi:hypothetical protein